MASPMPGAQEVADRYLESWARLDPVEATVAGLVGHHGEMTGYSPDGIAARAELAANTASAIASATAETAETAELENDRRFAALLVDGSRPSGNCTSRASRFETSARSSPQPAPPGTPRPRRLIADAPASAGRAQVAVSGRLRGSARSSERPCRPSRARAQHRRPGWPTRHGSGAPLRPPRSCRGCRPRPADRRWY